MHIILYFYSSCNGRTKSTWEWFMEVQMVTHSVGCLAIRIVQDSLYSFILNALKVLGQYTFLIKWCWQSISLHGWFFNLMFVFLRHWVWIYQPTKMWLLGLLAVGQKCQVMKKLMNQELKNWEMQFVVAWRAIRFETYYQSLPLVTGDTLRLIGRVCPNYLK